MSEGPFSRDAGQMIFFHPDIASVVYILSVKLGPYCFQRSSQVIEIRR